MRRATGALGVVLLIAAVALALMPFKEGAVGCGSPLLGGEAAKPDDGHLVLIVPLGCTDSAVGRLVLATALFVSGIVMIVLVLVLGWTADRRRIASAPTGHPRATR